MSGRPNQKLRTRKALLAAASRLMQGGGKPSLEEIAEEALVSRATAYRYFTNVEALLVEAALDVATPDAETVFADAPTADPVARLERVDAAFDELLSANETHFRTMLAHSMTRAMGGADDELPARQNRRSPLIEAALAPAGLEPAARDTLAKALAVLIGTESMVVFKDVLQLDAAEAARVKRWAIRALVDAARRG
jgi:AcrR family transcriptional regulator